MILDTLGRETPPGRSPWWPLVIGVCIALTIWRIVDVRRRARVDGRNPHSTDFTVYTEAGATFFDGRDPYAVTNRRGWRYLYPPLFAILVAPLHPLDPPWQATVWIALSAAMSFGRFFECRSIMCLPTCHCLSDMWFILTPPRGQRQHCLCPSS